MRQRPNRLAGLRRHRPRRIRRRHHRRPRFLPLQVRLRLEFIGVLRLVHRHGKSRWLQTGVTGCVRIAAGIRAIRSVACRRCHRAARGWLPGAALAGDFCRCPGLPRGGAWLRGAGSARALALGTGRVISLAAGLGGSTRTAGRLRFGPDGRRFFCFARRGCFLRWAGVHPTNVTRCGRKCPPSDNKGPGIVIRGLRALEADRRRARGPPEVRSGGETDPDSGRRARVSRTKKSRRRQLHQEAQTPQGPVPRFRPFALPRYCLVRIIAETRVRGNSSGPAIAW